MADAITKDRPLLASFGHARGASGLAVVSEGIRPQIHHANPTELEQRYCGCLEPGSTQFCFVSCGLPARPR